MPKRKTGTGLTANQQIDLYAKAMSGDIAIVITPETVTPVPVSTAWTRDVKISLQTKAGEIHRWMDLTEATILSVGDTSTAGTASIVATTITIVAGEALVVVSGDAQDWLNTETDTLTVGDMTVMGYTVTGGTSVETFTT